MKDKILRLLKNREEFVSGQAICSELGVSRTAVWKTMNQLKEEGYEIKSVNNRGYKLVESPDLVTAAEVKSLLNAKWIGEEVVYFDTTDSTNTQAKRLAEEGAANGTVVVADCQEGGKGRRGKSWCTPKGEGISFSIILRPNILAVNASMLTLVAGLAVAKVVKEVLDVVCKIKWPNDIVSRGKKLTGILTELSTEVDYVNYVVVGIGINGNNLEFPEEIASIATSLAVEKRERIHRADVIAACLESFEMLYERFLETEDLSGMIEEYNELLINREKEVRVISSKEEIIATAKGINERGELIILDQNQKEQMICSGEVSVRGLYGYT